MTVAGTLRSHCHFEASLKWYELAFNPLHRDNSWQRSAGDSEDGSPTSTTSGPGLARTRAVLLEYLETLLQWAESLTCQNSSDASQQAVMIFNLVHRIVGARPRRVSVQDPGSDSMTVDGFVASPPALNPRLTTLFDRLADGRSDVRYFDGIGVPTNDLSPGEWDKYQTTHSSHRRHPYRFSYLLPKAVELAGMVASLGTSLLAAFERGDTEYLTSFQATHERQLMNLTLDSRQNQFREADWEVQGLQKSLVGAMCRLTYNTNLISNGLIAGETGFQDATAVSVVARTGAALSLVSAEALTNVPDVFEGDAGLAGPLTFARVTGGTALSSGLTWPPTTSMLRLMLRIPRRICP